MTDRPYMKFFPADWRADPRLRMCSLAAKGLWIDIMAYMHEGAPYGHLTIDGIAPDARGLAALVGRPLGEVRKALAELEAKQVFSRTADGVIFSRRMVRDDTKAQEGRKHAGNRWGNREATAVPNRSVGGSPNRLPNGSPNGNPNTYSPESRVQRKKDAAHAAPAAPANGLFGEQDPDAELFRRGRELFGKQSGGLMVKLKKAKKGNISEARKALEAAARKDNPREYVGKIIAGTEVDEDWASGIPGVI